MTDRAVEDVWDYPRPPSIELSDERVVVELGGQVVADTTAAYRICETSHPPTYYLPRSAFAPGVLVPVDGTSFCEWKGAAAYLDLVTPARTVPRGAWTYPSPTARYADLLDHVALYPGQMDRCTLDGEEVQAQEGDFYGGWITSRVRGPFKGAPGTWGW
ncbi:MAG: DUF427 domain-containing protein [Nocardioidaceae bacterium]|nr:DUF427 domain-containing protein [Nocardioidaceae bacterium]